jgi:hypothetical protein
MHRDLILYTDYFRFLTSKRRIIDFGPQVLESSHATLKTSWLLARPAEVQAVLMNKRIGTGAGAVIAVQTSVAGENPPLLPQPWTHLRVMTKDEPPATFRSGSIPLFKDEIFLENGLVVYAEIDRRKRRICKGFRNTAEMIGFSDKVLRGAQSVLLTKLDEWCLVNVHKADRFSVRLVRRKHERSRRDKMKLSAGFILVWWTGMEGTMAEIRKREHP